MKHYKEVRIPVSIIDVFSREERLLMIEAVRYRRATLVPVSETGQKELFDKLDDLDERLSKGV